MMQNAGIFELRFPETPIGRKPETKGNKIGNKTVSNPAPRVRALPKTETDISTARKREGVNVMRFVSFPA